MDKKKNDSNLALGTSNTKERAKEKEGIAAGASEAIFARRIRVLRRVLGISASELDRQTGFGAGTIGRLERENQRIYASHLYRIGETTGVGVDYFYMGLDGSQSENGRETEEETINIKNDIDYLLRSLETAKADKLRGNIKIVADLLTAELADELSAKDGAEEE
ncbi:MAG: hypothetical protein KAI27_03400 [Rhodospirillaceae bacterium]|nr:hypothetical protein [Rhodospirillaceae bacterium]